MSKRKDIPPEGAKMLSEALGQVRPAEAGMLSDLELDWPGSRALLARLGVALAAHRPEEAQTCLCSCLCGGLDAYRAARKARIGDQGRFAAFVAGLAEALAESGQRALVIQSLSPLQHRAQRLAAEDHG